MPIFNYKGRDSTGVLKSGRRVAYSASALSTQLLQEGIYPISILEGKPDVSFIQRLNDLFAKNSVSNTDLAIFSRQMYTLAKTGVPIAGSLKNLGDNTLNPALAKALYGLQEQLEEGKDLASSMENYSKIFPPLMISMIKVGQSSGRLAEAFLQINQYLELEGSAIRNIKTALRYPLFVFIAMVCAIVVINIFVVPAFAHVFAQAGIELPWATRFLIGMSNLFINYWILLLIIVIFICTSFVYYIRTIKGRLRWDKFVLNLPVVGKLLRRIILMRFSQTFAITLDSGVPITEGITLVADALNNEFARSRILLMREAIERGKTLTQAAVETGMFTSLELQMLSVSEQTGELSEMLKQIAEFYNREVEYDLRRLSDVIEPALILVLSAVILILAFAVYLPIWNMAKVAKIG